MATEKKTFFHGRLSFRKYGSFPTYINILIGYIDTVLILNLFFLVTSLGIITIGPGLAAMHQVYEDIIGNRTEKRYRAYFRYFAEDFTFPIILFGLLLTAMMAGFSYGFFFFQLNFSAYPWMVVFFVLDIVVFLFLARLSAYFFTQFARMTLPFKTLFSNALRLSLGYFRNLLVCDLGFVVFFGLPLIFVDRAFPVFLIIGFAGTVLSCMMSVYGPVNNYVLMEDKPDTDDVPETKATLHLDLIDTKKTSSDSSEKNSSQKGSSHE